jgi:Uma2 family endonuclease
MAIQQPRVESPPGESEQPLITGEQLAAMGDIGPSELVEGRIVYISPTKPEHGEIEDNLALALTLFVRQHKLGKVQTGEVGIYTRRNPDTVRGADVLFISYERRARRTPGSFLDVAPELVAEILSPNDRWSDLKRKLREYFEAGVIVVVIVDPEEHTVAAYRSLTDVREFQESDPLTIEDVLPGFSVPVAELFV